MTTTTSAQASTTPASRRRLSHPARWAGIGYLLAWIVGLIVWPSNLALDAPPVVLSEVYRRSSSQVAVQYLLVEGLAALLLAVVIIGLGRSLRSQPRTARVGVGSGLLASAVSLTQCALGMTAAVTADTISASRLRELVSLVDRLDGGKMILIAISAAALGVAWPRCTRRPRWLTGLGGATSLALLVSAITYFTLDASTGWTVYVSGPLLFAWVAASGITAPGRPAPGRPAAGTTTASASNGA